MRDKFKNAVGKAKESISSVATMVGDLNGDGKVDEHDLRIATDWAKNTVSSVGDEAARIAKEAVRSDMAKDATAGAAIGAAIAVPVPVIGPIAGAVVGAGLGVYKNLTKSSPNISPRIESNAGGDVYAELLKLDDLRQKNILTDGEFQAQKKKILSNRL